MRIILLLSLLFLFGQCDGHLAAQGDTPKAVLEAFSKKYPAAKKVKWGIDRNKSFEAHYRINGIRYRADFDPDGSWIETERSLDWHDLPDAVQDAIKAEYDKDDIVELEFTDNAKKGEFYDVELDPKGKKKFDVEFREDGSRL